MRLIDNLYDFDAWLVDGKVQSISNWTFVHFGISNFRLAQLGYMAAFVLQVWAVAVFPDKNGWMFGIFAVLEVWVIICLEVYEFRYRTFSFSAANPIRARVADQRAFQSPIFLLVTVAYAVFRHLGVEQLQGSFTSLQIASTWCFIVATFFASCEYPPPAEQKRHVMTQQV